MQIDIDIAVTSDGYAYSGMPKGMRNVTLKLPVETDSFATAQALAGLLGYAVEHAVHEYKEMLRVGKPANEPDDEAKPA